jgi:hypothetical protein
VLEGFDDHCGTVLGGIVGIDDLHVLPVLLGDRIERLLQVVRLVEARNQNTDLRRLGQGIYFVLRPIVSQSVFLAGHAARSSYSQGLK